jgi:diguanylate cyclase (GGDEF)-like protein/PAS domain S-box-containing protein
MGSQSVNTGMNEMYPPALNNMDVHPSSYHKAIFTHNAAGILIVDSERVVIDINPALSEMLLFTPDELIGVSVMKIHFSQETYHNFQAKFKEAFTASKTVHTEYQFRRKDGSTLWAKILGARITLADGNNGVLWSIVDTSDLHDIQERMAHYAFHDALTGLPNRRSLDLHAQQMMQDAAANQQGLVVALVDLDNFKPVNDTYGHDAGDGVLRVVSERLVSTLSARDFIARLGGDEFVLILSDLISTQALDSVFGRLERAIGQPIQLGDGHIVQIGMSVGIAKFPEHESRNSDILLRYADQALYASKAHKNDREHVWVCYGSPHRLRQNEIQKQLYSQGPQVWYQPIVDIQHGGVVGFEALARFYSKTGDLLEPSQFMRDLSHVDLLPLTLKVFGRALDDLHQLNMTSSSPWVSINLPPQIVDEQCVEQLQTLLFRSGVPAQRITLEIMEGTNFSERETALNHLMTLKKLGVKLAIDDVGIGYASLQRIRELPIDKIKLDQTFVRTLQQNPRDMHFVHSVQELANGLNLELIVEGVETPVILDAINTLGVRFVQGFGIIKPGELLDLIDQLRASPFSVTEVMQPSLLGLYAAQYTYYNSLIKILQKRPELIELDQFANVRCSPIHAMIHALDLKERADDLYVAHEQLHIALGAGQGGARDTNYWKQVQAAQNRIEGIILSLLREG